MKKVSILIPVYNVQDFIIRCLESVAAQTFSEGLECIIVDDCGNDESMYLVEKYIAQYVGPISFYIIRHEHNRGLAAARNTAVLSAQGEFVFHLDSDDWLEATAIELLVEKQQETNADIVSGNALKHTKEGISILEEPDYEDSLAMVHQTIEMNLDHVIWRRLIRKSLYSDHNIFAVEGVNIGEDHHTLPRLVYFAKRIAKIDNTVYHYNCLNPNSYMSTNVKGFNLKRFRNNLDSIDILIDFFGEKDDYCKGRLNEIKSQYIKHSLLCCCSYSDKDSFNSISIDYSKNQSYYFTKLLFYALRLKVSIGSIIKKVHE